MQPSLIRHRCWSTSLSHHHPLYWKPGQPPRVCHAQLRRTERTPRCDAATTVTERHKHPQPYRRDGPGAPLLGGCSSSLKALKSHTRDRSRGLASPPRAPRALLRGRRQNCTSTRPPRAAVSSRYLLLVPGRNRLSLPQKPLRLFPLPGSQTPVWNWTRHRRTNTDRSRLQLCCVTTGLGSPLHPGIRRTPSRDPLPCHHPSSLGT